MKLCHNPTVSVRGSLLHTLWLHSLQGCAELSEDYRPRIVYVVVQKRHHVRLFDASNVDARTQQGLKNLEPGTVIDHTIVSPALYDFYLNSHKDIPNAGWCCRVWLAHRPKV